MATVGCGGHYEFVVSTSRGCLSTVVLENSNISNSFCPAVCNHSSTFSSSCSSSGNWRSFLPSFVRTPFKTAVKPSFIASRFFLGGGGRAPPSRRIFHPGGKCPPLRLLLHVWTCPAFCQPRGFNHFSLSFFSLNNSQVAPSWDERWRL